MRPPHADGELGVVHVVELEDDAAAEETERLGGDEKGRLESGKQRTLAPSVPNSRAGKGVPIVGVSSWRMLSAKAMKGRRCRLGEIRTMLLADDEVVLDAEELVDDLALDLLEMTDGSRGSLVKQPRQETFSLKIRDLLREVGVA